MIVKILKYGKNREILLKIKSYQIRSVITCSVFQTHWKHVSFVYQKIDDGYYKFIFINPIELKNIEINVLEHEQCTFDNNMKNCFSVDYFEKIIEELLNLNIPFQNFKEWIIGLPGHECDYIKGYLEKIDCQCNNNNFVVLYKSYFNSSDPILSQMIEILCNDNYHFNIKIYNWKIL